MSCHWLVPKPLSQTNCRDNDKVVSGESVRSDPIITDCSPPLRIRILGKVRVIREYGQVRKGKVLKGDER